MLVWKTQTRNVNVASLRYRCLLPVHYLTKLGVSSVLSTTKEPSKITADARAVIFVKSFHRNDVAACEQAYQLGVPIILDICDNIFIEEYAPDCGYVPADNFRRMAKMATAIVATGSAMKAAVARAIAQTEPGGAKPPPIFVIPDGSESLSDIRYALRVVQQPSVIAAEERGLKRILHSVAAIRRADVIDRIKAFYLVQVLRESYRLMRAGLGILPSEKISVEATPLRPKPWPKAAGVKTVLWFGNYGEKYGNFGMLNILDTAAALKALSQECSLRLMVVSNRYETYEANIAPLPFETHYLPWHPCNIYDYIRASDVVIIPNSQSVYSICKSANRAVLSLSQGTPVVASRTPALGLFEDCVWFDDWAAGLRAYLFDADTGKDHVRRAQQVIAQHLSGEAIAQQWLSLLDELAPVRPPVSSLPSKEAA